jgi:hypothetical protein
MIQYIDGGRFKRNGHPDEEFIVTWEIAVQAQNYVDAARQARAIQTKLDTQAQCFVVMKVGKKDTKIVDFGEESTLDNPDTPD